MKVALIIAALFSFTVMPALSQQTLFGENIKDQALQSTTADWAVSEEAKDEALKQDLQGICYIGPCGAKCASSTRREICYFSPNGGCFNCGCSKRHECGG